MKKVLSLFLSDLENTVVIYERRSLLKYYIISIIILSQ